MLRREVTLKVFGYEITLGCLWKSAGLATITVIRIDESLFKFWPLGEITSFSAHVGLSPRSWFYGHGCDEVYGHLEHYGLGPIFAVFWF